MSRKSLVFLSLYGLVTLAGVPFLGSKVVEARAEELPDVNDEVRMPTMNFYGDTKTQMAFTWNTTNYTDSDLEVVEKSINDFSSESVIRVQGTVDKSKVAGDGYVHRAVVTGLKANTEYLYRIGDIELKAFAETGSFKTSSTTNDSFSFIHASDPQGWLESHYNDYHLTLSQAVTCEPEFFVLSGDIVNNSWLNHTPVLEQWEWALTNQWDILKDYPIAAVSGNHDEADYDFYSRYTFENPNDNELKSGPYYSFDYNGVHFIAINTNDSGNRASATDAYGLSEKQLTWIRSDLAAHQKAKFRIAIQHKGLFDAGSHCANTEHEDYDIAEIRKQLAPIFTEYNVDLVLQGHDHLYSLSYPVVADSEGDRVSTQYNVTSTEEGGVIKRTFKNTKGTFYLNSGTASGSKYYANVGHEEEFHIMECEASDQKMFSSISIEGDKLVCETYRIIGHQKSLSHYFVIDKDESPVPPEPVPPVTPTSDDSVKRKQTLTIVIVVVSGSVVLLTGIGVSILLAIKKKRK